MAQAITFRALGALRLSFDTVSSSLGDAVGSLESLSGRLANM
jgi:hypothetical protein